METKGDTSRVGSVTKITEYISKEREGRVGEGGEGGTHIAVTPASLDSAMSC